MKTTNLFVELVVIGIGAVFGIMLIIWSIAGAAQFTRFWQLGENNIAALGFGLALTYVIGVVVDRLADRLFIKPTDRIKDRLTFDRDGFLTSKTALYRTASPLVDMIEYGRSRMRICRGWIVNMAGIIAGANLLMARELPAPWWAFLLVNLFLLIFGLGLFRAWRDLTRKEYEKISEFGQILRETLKEGPRKP